MKITRVLAVVALIGLLSHLGAAPQFIAVPQDLPQARALGDVNDEKFGYILKASDDKTKFEPRDVKFVVKQGAVVIHTETKPNTFTPDKEHEVKFVWDGTVDSTGLPANEGACTLTLTYLAHLTNPVQDIKSVARVDPYYIDGTGPVFSQIVPSNPEWLEEGQSISGTVVDPWAGVEPSTLVVEVDEASYTVGQGVVLNGSNFTVAAGTFNANLHTLRISVADKVGNTRVWESFFRGTDDPLPLMMGNGPMEDPVGTNGAFYSGIVGGAVPTFIKTGGLNAQVNVTLDVANAVDYPTLYASVDAAYANPSHYSMITGSGLHTARALIDLNSTTANDPYNATVQTSWGVMELNQARITPFLNRHGLSSVRYQISDRFGASFWNIRPTTDFRVYVISGDNTLTPNVSSAKALYDWLEARIVAGGLTGVRPVALTTFHEVEDFSEQSGMKHVFDIPVSAFRYGSNEKNFILLRTSGKAQVLSNLDFLNDVLESNEEMPGGNENRTFPTGEPYIPGPGGVHQKWEEQYEGGVSAFPDYLTFNGLVGGRALIDDFRYGGSLYANRDVQLFAQPGSCSGAVNYGYGFAQGGGEGPPYTILQNLISTVSGQMGSFTNLYVNNQSGEITGLNGAVERGNGSTQYYVAATQYRAWVSLDPALVSTIPAWAEVAYHQYDNLLNHPRDPPGGWQGGWNSDGISSEYRSQPNATADGSAAVYLIHRHPTGANDVAKWQDVWTATTETAGAPGVRAYKLSKAPAEVDVQTGERMWRYPIPVSELDQAPGGVNLLVWVDLQGTQADIAAYLNRHHFGTSQHIPNKQENYSVGEPYNPDYLRIRTLAPRAPIVGVSLPIQQVEVASTVNPLARWSVTSDIVASETVDVYAILVSPTGETRVTIALNAVPGTFTWTPALIPTGASLMKIVVTSDATGLTTVSRTPFRVTGIAGQGAQLEALYRMEALNGASGSETTPCENATMPAMQVHGGLLVGGAVSGSTNAVSLDQGEKGLVTESRNLGQKFTLGAWVKPFTEASLRPVVQYKPSSLTGEFPQTANHIGDIDFDGVEDVAAFSTDAVGGQNGYVYSGKDLKLIGSGLRELVHTNWFPSQVTGVGDSGSNSPSAFDGVADFAVATLKGSLAGVVNTKGFVTFYSGLHSGGNFTVMSQVSLDGVDGFAMGICDLGNVTGDAMHEIAIGSNEAFGKIYLASASGFLNGTTPAYTHPTAFNRFGFSMASLGDTDKDGLPEFAMAGEEQSVLIFEASPSGSVTPTVTYDNFISGGSPVNVGRTMDVLYDKLGASHLVLGRWGGESLFILNLRSGAKTEIAKSAAGITDTATQFGWHAGCAGDYDGDGLEDIITSYRPAANRDAYVIFSRTGTHLATQASTCTQDSPALDTKGFTRMVRSENGTANSVLAWVPGGGAVELLKWASDLTNLTDASGRNLAFIQWHRSGKLVAGTVATSDRVISTETVPSGAWRQVDLRVDADTERFDLNIGSNIYSIPTPKVLSALTPMARLHVGGGTSMQADEVGLWSRVLDDTEIAAIQANPVNTGTASPVVAFVSLTPASGSFLTSVPPIVATLNDLGVPYDVSKIFVTVDGVTYQSTLNIQANAPPRTVTLASYGDGMPVNVVCQVADIFGNVFTANTSFSVDGHAPIFIDDHLVSGSYFRSTGPSFSVKCEDFGSGLSVPTVEKSVDGGGYSTAGVSVVGDRVFVTLTGLSDEASHFVRLRAADFNGNSNAASPFEVSFFVDTVAPDLTDFFPVSGGHIVVEGDFGSSIGDFNFDPLIPGSRIITLDYPSTYFYDITNHPDLTITPTNWLHTGLTSSQLVPGQTYSAVASVRDAAGNWGYGQTTFTVAVPPQILGLVPSNGSTNAMAPLTLSGTFASGGAYAPLNTARCTLTMDGVLQTGVSFTDAGFTFNPGPPFNADGSHTMVVWIETIFGAKVSATSTFTQDAFGPVITPSNFTNGTMVVPGLALRWSIADTGTVTSAMVQVDSGIYQNLTSVGGGLYELAAQAPGSHTYTVRGIDAVGHPTLHPGSFTVPVVPQISTVTPTNGGFDISSPMTVSAVFATGATYAPLNLARCTLTMDNTLQTGVSFTNGAFSFQPGPAYQGEGPHVMIIWIEDIYGQKVPGTSSFTRDLTPPSVAPQSFVDGGQVFLNDTLVWTITDLATNVTDAVVRFDAGAFTNLTAQGGNLYSHAGISQGAHTYEVRATDAVGRTTLHPGSFTVLAMVDIVSLTPAHGAVTNDTPLTISGVFQSVPLALAQCTVTVDGVHFSAASANMTQQGFSFDPGATFETQGPHTAIVTLRAVSGVTADRSTTFTFDSIGPVIAPSNFTNGGTVFTSTPLRWSITDGAGVASAQISVDGQGAQAMTSVGGGLYEFSVSAIGPHTYVVTALDAVGNPGTHPGSFTVQYQSDPENPVTGSGPLPTLSPPNIPGGADSASHGIGAQETLGQGVNAFSGQFTHSQSILSRSGRGLDFELIATYRNQAGPLSALGDGWDLNYFMNLVPDSGDYLFHAGNGRVERFRSVGAEYISYQLPYKLVTSPLSLKTPSGTVFSFDAGNGGRLTAITDRNGNAITCGYTGSLLTSITDTLGVVTNLIYSGGLLVRVEEARAFGGGIQQSRFVTMDHVGSQLRSISMPQVGRQGGKALLYKGNGGSYVTSLSSLKALWESQGVVVDELTSWPSNIQQYSTVLLSGCTADFSVGQQSDMAGFLGASGRLIVVQHIQQSSGVTTCNTLMSALGMDMRMGQIAAFGSSLVIHSDPITTGVAELSFGNSFRILDIPGGNPKPVVPLVSRSGLSLIALQEVATNPSRPGGEVILMGNAYILEDYLTFAPHLYNPHRILGMNLLHFAASTVAPATRFGYSGADMTSITNRNGHTWLANTYDAQRRVVRQVCGAGAYNFAYTTVSSVRGDNQLAVMNTTCNDRMGFVSEYWLNSIGNCIESSVYGSMAANADAPSTPQSNWATVAVAPLEAGQVYTDRKLYSGGSRSPGLLKKHTQPMGGVTQWQIAFTDAGLNPLADRRAEFNVTSRVQTSDGRPGTSYSTISESWVFATNAAGAGVFDRVGSYTSPRGNVTSYTLDPANGDILSKTLPNVTSGAMPGEASGLTWTWTYNSFGQVLTETDPLSAGVQSTLSNTYGSVAGTDDFGRMITRTQVNLSLAETFSYNLAGDVVTHVDRRDIPRITRLNIRRRPVLSISARGFHSANVYDNEDNLVERREQMTYWPAQFHSVFTAFNSLNSPVSVTEALNASETAQTVSERNASNVEVATVSPEGSRTETDFNTRYKPYQVRTGVGAPVRPSGSTPGASAYSNVASRNVDHEYNANGELVKTSLPDDGTVDRHSIFRQDGFGRPYESEDAYGAITRNVLDADGDVIRSELYGQLERGTGGNIRLRETQNIWNEAGRLAQVDVMHFDPVTQANIGDGINRTTSRYLRCGMRAETENDLGHVWEDGFDGARRHISNEDPLGNVTTKTLDENGNATLVTSVRVSTGAPAPTNLANPMTLTNYYDYENNLTDTNSPGFAHQGRFIGPRGETLYIHTGYNGVFNNTYEVWYQYDEALRKTDESISKMPGMPPNFNDPLSPNQALSHWDYDLDGNMVAKIDPLQSMWESDYNDRGELELTTNPDATTVNPEYSVAGYMNEKTDEKGNRIAYTVGSDLLVHGYTVTQLGADTAGLAQGGTMAGTYSYNGAGEMVLAQDEDSRVARGFDSQGNMLSDTQREPGNLTGLDVPVVCTVNALGQPLTCTVPNGGRGTRVITNTYHGNELLDSVRDTAVSSVTDMAQVDWWGDAPFQWVTGVNQPVTARTNIFASVTMLPYEQTLVQGGNTLMHYRHIWQNNGVYPMGVQNMINNLGDMGLVPPEDIRFGSMGYAWNDGSAYLNFDRDKNDNLISDNAVDQGFNDRNGQTSRNFEPWDRDAANFVKDITEGTTRRHFVTDVLGHVVGYSRYVSEQLQETWLYRFDATGRRISKAQTVGGSQNQSYVYVGETLIETRSPWSATQNRFGYVNGVHMWTEMASGVTRHHQGPYGKTAYSTNEATGAILTTNSNFTPSPGEIIHHPDRDWVLIGTSGQLIPATSSQMNSIVSTWGGIVDGGVFNPESGTVTRRGGERDGRTGEMMNFTEFGAPSVGTTGISAESMNAYVAGACAEVDSSRTPIGPYSIEELEGRGEHPPFVQRPSVREWNSRESVDLSQLSTEPLNRPDYNPNDTLWDPEFGQYVSRMAEEHALRSTGQRSPYAEWSTRRFYYLMGIGGLTPPHHPDAVRPEFSWGNGLQAAMLLPLVVPESFVASGVVVGVGVRYVSTWAIVATKRVIQRKGLEVLVFIAATMNFVKEPTIITTLPQRTIGLSQYVKDPKLIIEMFKALVK